MYGTALEEYFSRCLGLNLLTVGILVIILTGAVPLASSVQGRKLILITFSLILSDAFAGTTAGITSATDDSDAPYKRAVLTIATAYHTASAIFSYVSHNSTGRWALMMGSLCSGLLASVGLWCLLFASTSGKISKTTGADKRTSAFPFQNAASASEQKKARKNM
jgi:hypothetical protein